MRVSLLIVVLFACGSDEPARIEPAPETTETTETTEATTMQTTETVDGVAESARPPTTSGLDAHSAIRRRVQIGSNTYALVERDLIAAARALPNGDALEDAFEEALGSCLGGTREDIRCVAEIAPNLGLLADTANGHGRSWTVVRIDGGRITTTRPLVALSVHDPAGDLTTPRMVATNMDGDAEDELLIEVPIRPLTDDIMLDWATGVSGSAMYVLNAELEVQARWTSSWTVEEKLDDGDSPPLFETCNRSEMRQDDGSILIEGSCLDGDGETIESSARCPWDSATDRHRCPRGYDEAFSPRSNAGPQYVGETEADLRRLLPRLFARAVATPTATPMATTTAMTTMTTCAFVVEDPAPPLHVRSERSSRSSVVGDLPNGTRVVFAERRGRWARIEAPTAGWIWTENVPERCE